MVHNMFSKSKCANTDNNFTNDSFNMLLFCNCIEIYRCIVFISALFLFLLLLIFIIDYFYFINVHILIYYENKIFRQ